MEQFSFVLTIFVMLLGPIKLIGPFATVTSGNDNKFIRMTAIWSLLISSAVVTFVAIVGIQLLNKYHISLDALRLSGGVVLLVAALLSIFGKVDKAPSVNTGVSAIKLAISPLTTPIIVPPAGVAAILIFMMLAPQYPGMEKAVALSLAIVMTLNFIVMFFNRAILKINALMMVFQLLGGVLVFMQVGLAIETLLIAFRHLGIISI